MDLRFDSQEKALELTQEIAEYLKISIIPIFNEIFDKIIPEDKHVCIEKLELDLGEICYDEVKHSLKKRIKERLYEAVIFEISKNRVTFDSDNKEKQLHDIIFFLRNGFLHWSTHMKEFNINTAIENQLKFNKDSFSKAIFSEKKNNIILLRLQYQLNKQNQKAVQQLDTPKRDHNKCTITEIYSDKSTVYINNAGLILISPFLPQLFSNLGYIRNSNFKSETEQLRAVNLLEYICNNEIEAPEYNMSLNKILCGLDLNTPLPLQNELNDKEKFYSIELLDSVIKLLGKSGAISTEEFQKSFLKRDGVIYISGDYFKLRVENRTYDTLLDNIPWCFEDIKHQWLEKKIEATWRC